MRRNLRAAAENIGSYLTRTPTGFDRRTAPAAKIVKSDRLLDAASVDCTTAPPAQRAVFHAPYGPFLPRAASGVSDGTIESAKPIDTT